ncbi:flippase-like domain-containing protein [Candidatus Saccharibacteria bacterium]|nr:flippase-like domain-containing protein [Candidatus Saccharibacteria bacterium]
MAEQKSTKLNFGRKKNWKKTLGIVLFVLLNIAVIAITAVNEFGNSANAAKLEEVKILPYMLIPAVLLFILATWLNIYKYVIMMKTAYTPGTMPPRREMWRVAWRVVMLGKYYDNITPAAIGGQPFQIYYMRKNSGLAHGHATALPLVGMVAGQMGFLVVAIICFMINSIMGGSVVLMLTAWLGLLFYAFWPIMIFGISYFPRPTKKFLGFLIKVLAKVRIIKNRDEALAKIERELDDYVKSIKMLAKTKYLLAKILILSIAYNVFIYLIPYFVIKAFGGDIGVFECFATTLAVTSAVYFVPTPGNSGAAEGTFYAVFSALSTGYIFWAMLVWRMFSYYIYIILGLLTYFVMDLEHKRLEKHDAARE